jgi:hypothetical protein
MLTNYQILITPFLYSLKKFVKSTDPSTICLDTFVVTRNYAMQDR